MIFRKHSVKASKVKVAAVKIGEIATAAFVTDKAPEPKTKTSGHRFKKKNKNKKWKKVDGGPISDSFKGFS